MNLENNWKEIGEAGDKDLADLLRKSKIDKLHSNHPLHNIKKSLLINMTWGLLIVCGYIVIMVAFPIWQVQLCLLVVSAFSLWAVYTAFSLYKSIGDTIMVNNPALDEMKRHYASIYSWMRTQQRVALFIYPVSIAGGFMLGGVLGSTQPVGQFLSKPFVFIALIITIAVLTPLCYLLSRWLFKISFGKHAAQLKENIDALELQE